MLNYYELIKLIKDTDAIEVIREEFKDDLAVAFGKCKVNKSTRAQACKNYGNLKELRADKEYSYLFGTSHSIFYSNSVHYTDEETGGKTADYAKVLTGLFKEMKPQDEYMDGCVALARALGWSPAGNERKYYIELEGMTYDFNKVYQLYMMIADSKLTGGVETYIADKFLIMKSRYGLVALLPFKWHVNDSYKVNFKHYVDLEKKLDERLVEEVKKTA